MSGFGIFSGRETILPPPAPRTKRKRGRQTILPPAPSMGGFGMFGSLGARGSACAASHADLMRLKNKVNDVQRQLDIMVRR